jgi:hypothetical protein
VRDGRDDATSEGVHVGFGGYEVSVHSAVPAFVAAVERAFGAMAIAERVISAGSVRVEYENGAYLIAGGGESDVPCVSFDEALQETKRRVIRNLSLARRDLLWLHGAAAVREGVAVILPGQGSRGKSTVVLSLCGMGWRYLGDDIVAYDLGAERIVPFPTTPAARQNGGVEVHPNQVPALVKKESILLADMICREPMPLGAILFPFYSPRHATSILPCPAGWASLGLIQSCMNFGEHRERAISAFCDLVRSLPSFYLVFDSGQAAAELVTKDHQHWHAERRIRGNGNSPSTCSSS